MLEVGKNVAFPVTSVFGAAFGGSYFLDNKDNLIGKIKTLI